MICKNTSKNDIEYFELVSDKTKIIKETIRVIWFNSLESYLNLQGSKIIETNTNIDEKKTKELLMSFAGISTLSSMIKQDKNLK